MEKSNGGEIKKRKPTSATVAGFLAWLRN